LIKNNINPSNAKIAILGITFKENCPDLRNTKVVDIKENLEKYNCKVIVSDEFAANKESISELNIPLVDLDQIQKMDALIIAVEHKKYTQFNIKDFEKFLNPNGCLIDVKSIYKIDYFSKTSFTHWRL
jgi:UDP-N-acetyl-D-glucosamine/UDP-N-acetyl-D-galactosamine dehydrogenase